MRIDSESSASSVLQSIIQQTKGQSKSDDSFDAIAPLAGNGQDAEDQTASALAANGLKANGQDTVDPDAQTETKNTTSSFVSGKTLTEEEQRRLLELEQELTAMLGEAPEKMTEEKQRRIREIEQEMADITGVKLPAKGRVAQVAQWMKKDGTTMKEKEEKQAEETNLTDQQLLDIQSDDVRQWRLNQLSLKIETPPSGEGLLSFIKKNAAEAYARQSSSFSSGLLG